MCDNVNVNVLMLMSDNVFEYEHFVISVWLKVFDQHNGPAHA